MDSGSRCGDWITGRVYDDAAYGPLMDRSFRHLGLDDWWRENYLGWLRYRCGEERLLAAAAGGKRGR